MPKPLKFPGLQPKFEAALQVILENEALSGGDIQNALQNGAMKLGLTDEEANELKKNFANYIARAKTAEVIRSGGPWAGYELIRRDVPDSTRQEEAVADEGRQPRQLEGAMHLVATCALSVTFGSLVVSLPKAVDRVSWGNADMLMLRGNPSRLRFADQQLDADLLKHADSSPECILSSIELKYGLKRDRRLWFLAIAEASANSRWANESMLVHVTPDLELGALDDEVVSLARTAEIGIIEIAAVKRQEMRSLEATVLVPAPQRSYLRLGELSGERTGLLTEVRNLLMAWEGSVVTYLDEEGAPQKLLHLLRRSIANLKLQVGFGAPPLVDSLGALKRNVEVVELFTAALDTISTFTDAAPSLAAAHANLRTEWGKTLTVDSMEQFTRDLGALVQFTGTN